MSHKFTIEYDMSQGLFSKDDGRDKCLGVYDTLDECEAAFPSAMEKVHEYYMELPFEKKQRTSYLVAAYVLKTDEDGELTDEDGWYDLSDDDKRRLNALSHSFEQ